MRIPVFAVLLTAGVLLLAGCEGGKNGPPAGTPEGPGPEAEDPATPVTVEFSPAGGAEKVALDSQIRLTFSVPMAPAASAAALSIKPEVNCTPTWSEGNTILECAPAAQLAPATHYTVSLATTARSEDGRPLSGAVQASFTTAAADAGPGNTVCIFDTDTFDGGCVFGD